MPYLVKVNGIVVKIDIFRSKIKNNTVDQKMVRLFCGFVGVHIEFLSLVGNGFD